MSSSELRVYLVAPELAHEYLEPFNELLAEYRLPFERLIGLDPSRPKSGRPAMMAFTDAVPTLKIAVDTQLGLFRDPQRGWSRNNMYDIDAVAAPYCRVVIADKDLVHRAVTNGAADGLGTVLTSQLDSLVDLLGPLRLEAKALGSSTASWDDVGPGYGFNTALPGPASHS